MLKRYINESKWWMYAAGTLPFAALTGYVVGYIFDLNTFIECLTAGVVITFVSASVFWWWWAISRIKNVFLRLEKTTDNFKIVIDELRNIKKEIPNNVGDRKRRK